MKHFKGCMQDRNLGPLLPDVIVYYLTFILFQITLKYFISSNQNVFKVLILVSVLTNFNI